MNEASTIKKEAHQSDEQSPKLTSLLGKRSQGRNVIVSMEVQRNFNSSWDRWQEPGWSTIKRM